MQIQGFAPLLCQVGFEMSWIAVSGWYDLGENWASTFQMMAA